MSFFILGRIATLCEWNLHFFEINPSSKFDEFFILGRIATLCQWNLHFFETEPSSKFDEFFYSRPNRDIMSMEPTLFPNRTLFQM